jgi:hypothetical protein
MVRNLSRPPSDAQIDRLILEVAVSGRISHTDLETLTTHIHTLRAQAVRSGDYNTPNARCRGRH